MRKYSRQSFTVEIKSNGRRNTTLPPTRIANPVKQPLRESVAVPDEPTEPAPEQRRILPNLTVPLAEVEQIEAAEARQQGKRRGRPRKPIADMPEPAAVAALAVAPPPAAAPLEPQDRPAAPSMARQRRPSADLALAPCERWKRRLSRWSR